MVGNLPKGIKSSPILSPALLSRHHESLAPNDIAPPHLIFSSLYCACLALLLDNANAVSPALDVGACRRNDGVTTSYLGAYPPLGECSQAQSVCGWDNPSNALWQCQGVCTPRLYIQSVARHHRLGI